MKDFKFDRGMAKRVVTGYKQDGRGGGAAARITFCQSYADVFSLTGEEKHSHYQT